MFPIYHYAIMSFGFITRENQSVNRDSLKAIKMKFLKRFFFYTILYCNVIKSFSQNFEIAFATGPSIPIFSYSSKNAELGVIRVDNVSTMLDGYWIQKTGFATIGKFIELSPELILKNKSKIALTVGTQNNPVNLTNLENLYTQYFQSPTGVFRFYHDDYQFNYLSLNYLFYCKLNKVILEIGPALGYEISTYPNYHFYFFKGQTTGEKTKSK